MQKIAGVVKRVFTSNERPAYTVQLNKSVLLEGQQVERVNIGGMRGFEMALQAAGLERLSAGDRVVVASTGTKPPDTPGHSPMVLFDVEVTRDGKIYNGKTEDAGDPFLGAEFWTGR